MFLDINGNRLFTLSFGNGPKTFLAHSGWVGNFEDWIATLSLLSTDWRVVIYDHRGSGESPVPADRITADALVDDLFAVMDALSIETCTLAGFSRGSVTALRAVLRQPERFDGLMLLNGNGGVTSPDTVVTPRVPPSQWPGETHQQRLEWFATACTPEPDALHIRRWAVNLLSRSSPEAAEASFMSQPSEPIDWPLDLGRLTLPTLLVHGELDPLVALRDMEYLQTLLPRSKLVVMEGSGHLPAMTRPRDVAREINDFFRGQATTD